jgi:hypothetical protein
VPSQLTDAAVRNVILTWYHGTNAHLPVEELDLLLTPDVEMSYPNRSSPFTGRQAFRDWYADVLTKYFDETHLVESLDIVIAGSQATATVVVRWERREWQTGAARSEYGAFLSRQLFTVVLLENGQVMIQAKHVETFTPTAPVFDIGT